MQSRYDYFLKIIAFSDNEKLARLFVEKSSGTPMDETSGLSYAIKELESVDAKVKLQLWHADQSAVFSEPATYRAEPSSMLRAPHAVIYLYDMANPDFERMKIYTQILKEWYPKSVIYIAGVPSNSPSKDNSDIITHSRLNECPHLEVELGKKANLTPFLTKIIQKCLVHFNLSEQPFVVNGKKQGLFASKKTPERDGDDLSFSNPKRSSWCCF